MAYTKGYTLDATPGGDTVKEAIVDKLDALGIDGIFTSLNTHEGLATGIHGVGAGSIVGTTLSQTLSNKTISGNLPIITTATNQGISLTTTAGTATILIQGTPAGGGVLTLQNNSNTGISLTDTTGVTVTGATLSLSLTQASIQFTNTTRTYSLQAVTSGDYFRILIGGTGDGLTLDATGNVGIYNNLTVSGLTATRPVWANASKVLTTPTAATFFSDIKQAASETATGVAELATNAEVGTGTDTERIVTPAGLKYKLDNSPTIVTPTIASFTNATHNHQNSAGGATLDHGAALTGLSDNDHTQYARSGPIFFASKSSDQDDITTTTDTKITFTSENWDPEGTYDTTNSRWTPGVSGTNYWLINFQVYFHDATSGANTRVALYKNGSSVYIAGVVTPNATESACNGSFLAQTTSSSDYFELYIWTTTGSNALDINGSTTLTWWTGCAAPRNWS